MGVSKMNKGSKLAITALVGGICGYVGYKYGKDIVNVVKANCNKESVEKLTNDIKGKAKDIYNDKFVDFYDEMKDFADVELPRYIKVPFSGEKKEPVVIPVEEVTEEKVEPVAEVVEEKVEPVEEKKPAKKKMVKKVEKKDEDIVPPLDVQVSENPEALRKEVVELLKEAEAQMKEETKSVKAEKTEKTGAEKLKARQAQKRATKKKAEEKVEKKIEETV